MSAPDLALVADPASTTTPVAALVSAPAADNSPEARMARRFPQKVRVGDLIGREVVSDDYDVLGPVTRVVRTPTGKIRLIVAYSRWFGLFSRPVAVPIELVGALGKQVGSIDMRPEEYRAAPTWVASNETSLADDEIILIAIAKR
jgi:hypothetical protein